MKKLLLVPFLALSVAHADENLFERGVAEGKTPYTILAEAFKNAKPAKINDVIADCFVDGKVTDPEMRELYNYIVPTSTMADVMPSDSFFCQIKEKRVIQPGRAAIGTLFPAVEEISEEKSILMQLTEYFVGKDKSILDGVKLSDFSSTKVMKGLDEVLTMKGSNEQCGDFTQTYIYRKFDNDFILSVTIDCSKDPKRSLKGYDYRFKK